MWGRDLWGHHGGVGWCLSLIFGTTMSFVPRRCAGWCQWGRLHVGGGSGGVLRGVSRGCAGGRSGRGSLHRVSGVSAMTE
jgi:hypothetical protein